MDGRRYISVILPLKLEWEPCYYIDSSDDIEVGKRVRVKFAGKEYVGVVSGVDITPDITASKIQSIISIEVTMEKIRTEEIHLWKRVAEYYLCTVGEVYKAAYPTSKINLEEARAEAKERAIQRREKLVELITKRILTLQDRLQKKGAQLEKSLATGKINKTQVKLQADIERISEDINRAQVALEAAQRNAEAAKAGLNLNEIPLPECMVQLTEAQQNAYGNIIKGFETGKPVMLHGATGSGKTEIYIKAAHKALSEGKNVLYLVPEIALSRQLEDRLYEHFEDRLMIFHSGESAASKRNIAEIIRTQEGSKGNYILLGTRSSLFLPHHNLGLIIVDEEHDSSYKQDSPAPRYNGRDTALMLSRIHKGCSIILGSATPSLEELYNTSAGRHVLVELKERFHQSEDTPVELIDTKAERLKRGMVGNFSRKLIDHIRFTLAENGQVLILRSRRAWSTALQCQDCGEIQKCPHCNVSLSHHKSAGRMQCHYCGGAVPYTGKCAKCGGPLNDLGAGTQRIEEEATALFPDARIARLDSDTAQNKTYEAKTIKSFAKGEIDILIGTQIITKGFDFEKLRLVAVIAADTLLGIQDFRADEKAMHLLEQFRGRCGRRDRKGLFVIQTSQPEHPIYQYFTSGDPISFNTRLLSERKDFDFPPYTRNIELTIKDIYEDRAERMSGKLASRLCGYTLTGPYVPVISKIADKHIRKIRLSLRKDRELAFRKEELKRIIAAFEKSEKYDGHISIDVDPS